ncbi:titin isoform X12 [Labrus bergylta]|uniref:titin isoform X12 n=1 Tax=Labrus bergylta TaxID=56723 RepID=UPI0033131F28
MGCFYFLASFLFTSCLVLGAEPPTKYVLKGTGESLKPTFSGQPNSILWKHNGNKVVEFDSREEQVYGAYKNRITLDWVSAELEITGLKFEDRGLYEVEVDINNMLHLSEFKLEVIDKVAMPTISCEINKDGGSDVSEVRATLLCSADPTPPESMMKFEWRARGKSQPGHKFNISLGDERDNEEYRCSVSNPVSSETATFTAKYCYHVLGAEPPTKYVLKGTGESLKPTFSGQPNSILWKHNGNKVVEFDSREQKVYGAYKNRITLDWATAELEIRGLKFEDRGLYEVEVDINNMLHLSEFKLEVIDKVAMPTISCEINKDGGSDVSEVRATLLCSADPTPPESMMKFEWRARGKSQPGHKFNISLGDERDNEEYNCSVSNPVSSETATFTAKDCYHVLGAEPPTKYVLKGTGESLKPTFSGQPNSILWKHNGNKVVEFDSREQEVYGAYKNRITLDWVSAELEITGLKFEDRGLYEVEVDINNMLHLSQFKLEVIDKVAMPTISCELNKDGGSDVSEVRATLLCSADPTPPESMMKFEWRARGKSQPGHKFNISLGDERDNEEYSCSVSNPVSSETATFTAKDCYHVLGAEPPTKYVLKGTGESLKPTFSGQPNSILWKHNGNKVVEFDSREEQVYGAYKNRITLDWVSAELEITGLKLEDRGLYEVEVDINNMLHLSEFKLEVIDKVAMPTISCEINKDGGSDVSEVRATLLCSADPTPPESMMKFEWRARGKSQPGHKFNISLGDERDNEEYSCSVSNPVSSETATFTAKDCYHDNSSVAVAVSLTVVGLIVLGLIIFFCKKRQKACFAKGQQDDEEKQTEGSDKKKAQGGETRHLLAETLLSDQPLNVSYSPVNVKKMAGEINRRAGQEPVGDKKPRKGNLKEKEDNIEKGEKPQQTKNITEPEKNQGGGEEASPVPPTDQTSPTLANSSPPKTERGPDEDPEDPAGGQKNGSDSDEDYEDTQDESVSQTDSSGTQQNRNESDKSSVNKSSSVPHEEGSNTTSQERESATPKEEESTEEAKPVKPVPPAEETSNLMSNGEEIDEKQHLADSTEVNTSNTLTLRLQTLHMQIQSLRGRAGRTQVRGGGQAEADQGEGGNDEDKEEDQGGPEDEKSDDEW